MTKNVNVIQIPWGPGGPGSDAGQYCFEERQYSWRTGSYKKKEIKIKYQLNINIILCVTLEGEKYKLLWFVRIRIIKCMCIISQNVEWVAGNHSKALMCAV